MSRDKKKVFCFALRRERERTTIDSSLNLSPLSLLFEEMEKKNEKSAFNTPFFYLSFPSNFSLSSLFFVLSLSFVFFVQKRNLDNVQSLVLQRTRRGQGKREKRKRENNERKAAVAGDGDGRRSVPPSSPLRRSRGGPHWTAASEARDVSCSGCASQDVSVLFFYKKDSICFKRKNRDGERKKEAMLFALS